MSWTEFIGPALNAVGSFLGREDTTSKFDYDAFNAQREYAEIAAHQEYARQKEFAEMGITWKSTDAKRAGLHPLAVIGSSGASYSPTISMPQVSYTQERSGSAARSGLAAGMQSMGQNLMRAQMATKTEEERRLEALAIRNAELRNSSLELDLAAKAASLLQPANPPMPSGAGSIPPSGAVRIEPSVRVSSMPGDRSTEAARTPLAKRFDMGGGASVDLPSQAAAESLEAMGPLSAPLAIGISSLRRAWHGPDQLPSTSLPAGYVWRWSPLRQAFEAVATRPRSYDTSGFGRWSGGRGNAPVRSRSGGATGSW